MAISALLAGLAMSALVVPGQAEDMHGLKIRQLPLVPTPTPFALDVSTGRRQTLEYRTPDQISAPDRDLVAANEAEIARRAGLQGFHLNEAAGGSGWGYEQAVCPVFPEHVVLEYSRRNGAGDVTLFSVVIPRAEGHVRVIPVQRRSYSLWTPAASNALTRNDFNHLLLEGHQGQTPDWLTLGLCYAALAGGHVRAALQAQNAAEENYPLFRAAELTVSRKGGALVNFTDVTPPAKLQPGEKLTSREAKAEKAMNWELYFSQSGQLTKVTRSVAGELVERPVRGAPTEVKTVPMRESIVDIGKSSN